MKVTIPKSVKSIGKNAFENCTSLASVEIPDSVTEIGEAAFSGCPGLAGPDGFVVIHNTAYAYFGVETEVCLPAGITKTCNTFCENHRVKSVAFPEGFTRIGGYTFAGCDNLESVIIPDSVTEVGENAFEGCKKLRKLTLPEKLLVIENGAFTDCESLSELYIPNSVKQLGRGIMKNCVSLLRLHLPDSLEELPGDTFRKCGSLIDLTLPKGMKRLGDGAFAFCKNLFEFELPNTLTEIESGVFFSCSGLRSIRVPDGIKVLRQGLFAQCDSLRHVELPTSLETIGDAVFFECHSLREITIPDRTQSIGCQAFLGCSGLTEVWIPNCVKAVGEKAFERCGKLTSITLENGVSIIEEKAFYNCRRLQTVVIPSSVKKIGFAAFYNCESLTIRTPKNSYGQLFAEINQIPVIPLKWSEEEWNRQLCRKRPLAEAGNAAAQSFLSGYYASHGKNGNPEEKDEQESLYWLHLAAAQNHPAAVRNLATRYYKGMSVEKDFSKAFTYYLKAAELGVPDCQFTLCRMYSLGEGIAAPDKSASTRWLFLAVESNYLPAITVLAKATKRYKDGMSTKELIMGEFVRRAVNSKAADMDRLKSDLAGVIAELAEKGDALAALLHDAAELPKLKFAERFMT